MQLELSLFSLFALMIQGQLKLLNAITTKCTTGKTIVLLNAGSPVSVEPFIDDVDACLQIWFGGQV